MLLSACLPRLPSCLAHRLSAEQTVSLCVLGRMLRDIEDGYELLVHNGDISYARGYVTQASFGHQNTALSLNGCTAIGRLQETYVLKVCEDKLTRAP